MKHLMIFLAACFLVILSLPVSAQIPREDVLECGFPDGSKFVLRAKYKWQPLSMIAPVGERERQENWGADYVSNPGSSPSLAPTSIDFSNTFDQELREACAGVGKRDGIPLVAFSYLKPDGKWLPLDGFPWDRLTVSHWENLKPPLKYSLDHAGFKSATYLFSLIMPRGGQLVFEQPLFRERVRQYFGTIEGVYQSFSTDGGKTWTDPMITTKAEIFEMGKPWLDQCFVARPIKLNGKKIEPDFPAPCAPRQE